MKAYIIVLLLICFCSLSQTSKSQKLLRQTSSINTKGNGNIIKVIQADIVYEFNLNKSGDSEKLLTYLKSIPELKQFLSSVLKYSKETLKVVRKISEDGVFNTSKFISEIESLIRKNESLQIELEKQKGQNNDVDYTQVLEEANKKLKNFDNDGYQQVLENFQKRENKRIRQVANSFYLQSKNSVNNYNVDIALKQIKKALQFEPDNLDFLFLKSNILTGDPSHWEESVNGFFKILELTAEDTLKATCLNNISISFMNAGKYDKAFYYLYQSMEVDKRVYGGNDIHSATTFGNIGAIHSVLENYDSALYYYYKGLGIFERILGKNDPATGIAYSNIGEAYNRIGDSKKALEYFNKDFAIQIKIFGLEHINTASCYGNIGNIYADKSLNDSALYFFNKELAIQKKYFGNINLDVARCYNNIGAVYANMTKYDSALNNYFPALSICQKILNDTQFELGSCYNNIGTTYSAIGKYRQALEYLKKALQITQISLGKTHPKTALCFYNIAWLCTYVGDYSEALNNCNQALAIYEAKFGKGHNDSKEVSILIGIINILKGDNKRGLSYFPSQQSNSEIVSVLSSNAQVMFSKRKYKENIILNKLAINILEKDSSANRAINIVILYHNLANTYCQNKDKEIAIELFNRSLTLAKEANEDQKNINLIKAHLEQCKLSK